MQKMEIGRGFKTWEVIILQKARERKRVSKSYVSEEKGD